MNDCVFTADVSASTQQVVSCSSDGTVKVWDAKTTECLQTFSPPQPGEAGTSLMTLHSLALLPSNVEQIVVCGASPDVHIMTLQGTVVKAFSSGKTGIGANFVACCTSPKGEFVHCLGQGPPLFHSCHRPSRPRHFLPRSSQCPARWPARRCRCRPLTIFRSRSGADGALYSFSTTAGKLERILQVHEKEPLGLAHHPHQNLLATFVDDGPLRLWRAK